MMLRTLVRPDQKDWVDRLPDIEFPYNTSVHPAIGVTPFELHHGGRKGRIFADLLLPRPADIDAACSPASVRKYRELLAQARTNMQKAQVRMQQQANRRRVPCPIRVGDRVWVSSEEFALEQDVSRKLLPKWFGPWTVTSAAGDEPDGPSFVIDIPEHLTVHPVFHASKLATYTPAKSDDFPGRRSQDPPSMDGHQEVDRVISDRKYGSKPRQYKVTFRACDPDDTRWISGADLKASAPLIYAHYERQRLAKGPPRPAPPTRTQDPSEKGLAAQEDPFDTITDNIPEKPVTAAEGASYVVVIAAGLAVASAAGYAVFKELVFQPREYKVFGKALNRVKNDVKVTSRLGTPITGYGDESTNRAARQRVRHKVYKDEDGVEHIQVQFLVRGPIGAGTVHCEMFYDEAKKDWRFTYLIVDVTSPLPAKRIMLESYIPS
uniref:Tf2-1-like SH3-like domain-containing protein n=1 Tax=Chara braunii TaxID=69332 RepID=A0A388KJG1_CHABU